MIQGDPELQFGEHANEIIKKHILLRPVFMGDIIPIINSTSQPINEQLTTSQVIPLVAVETDPTNSVVLITEATAVELRKKEAAGVLYHRLEEGECSLNQIKTHLNINGIDSQMTLMAVGWLAREDKISIYRESNRWFVRLNE
jgi:hypothetical protein